MRGKRALAAVALVAAVVVLVLVANAGGAGGEGRSDRGSGAPSEAAPGAVDEGVEPSSPTTTIQPGDVPGGDREPRIAPDAPEELHLVELEARQVLGADFAGVWRTADGAHHVGTTTASRSADAAGLGGEVHVVVWSLDELEAHRARLDEAGPAVIEAGLARLAAWWVDPAANAVVVEVIGAGPEVEAAARALEERLGVGPWELRAVSGPARETRLSDGDPHNGGAKITNAYATCTSGPPWVKPTNPPTYEIATSGHCIDPYNFWTTAAGWFGVSGSTWNGMDGVGSNHVDAAMIYPVTASQPYFYVGPANGTGLVYQAYQDTGWQSGLTGLRTSGAITGEYQAGTGSVLSTNSAVAFYDAGGNYTDTRYGLNRADCWVAPGDSGGPVFKVLAGGHIKVLGVMVADVGQGLDTLCYYTPVVTIINKYGGGPMG